MFTTFPRVASRLRDKTLWLNSINLECPLFNKCQKSFVVYKVHCLKRHNFEFISCTVQFNVHSETSTGIKSCITLRNTCGFRSPLPATLTFAERIWPSLPGNSSWTFASFQKCSFRQIRLHDHNVTYWDWALLVLLLTSLIWALS